MHMKLIRTVTFRSLVLLLAMLGCRQPGEEQAQTGRPVADSVKLILTGTDLTPELLQADSLLVLFYKNPFGDDPDRYTRYYRQYGTRSDKLIGLLKANLGQPFREDTLRYCRSEGKIYVFASGKPVQTVYFTAQGEGCHHLYFIHTGRYYYFAPDSALEARLQQVKPLAAEP